MYIKHMKNSFSMKLICIFLMATVIPLILISVIFYQINVNTSREKIMDAVRLTNNQLVQQIEARLEQLDIASDTLQYYMYSLPSEDDVPYSRQLDAFSTLRTNVSTLETSFHFKHICIFLDSASIFSQEGLMFYSLERLDEFSIAPEDLENLGSASVWKYIPDQVYPFMLDKTYDPIPAIVCIRGLHDRSDDSLVYVYFISIDATEFTQLLTSAYTDMGISGYLIDDAGTVAAGSDLEHFEGFSSEQLEQFRSCSQYDDGAALYYITGLSNGWLYVTCVPDSYIHANTQEYIRIFLIVLALIVPLATCTVILLTRNLTRRIYTLSDSAGQVNFSQNQFHGTTVEYVKSIPEKNYDEVDLLAVTYNRMMQTIYENIDHITELKAHEESLKYQLLQSLINPHFLYNILDSIAVCNRLGKPETANKMIMDLTRFYRMTLRKSDELISIRDELEIARLYMELESVCRGGNFTWEISMDEEIENFMICKFTLQPFLENSIRHGMQGLSQHLHIQIDIRYGEDTIQIFILDNGHGIPPEKLRELRSSLESRQVDTSRHFGICNVNARISSELFGHGFIEIDSSLEEGTFVKIEFQQILP